MTETAPKTVRIECVVNPDVHLGDGRILHGPQKEGTKTIVHGQVTEVDAGLAEFLIDRGQVQKTSRAVTVLVEDTDQYKVEQAEAALSARRAKA